MRVKSIFLAVMSLFLAACRTWQAPIAAPSSAERRAMDFSAGHTHEIPLTLFERLAEQIPEFGGAFADEHWNYVVYLTDLSKRDMAAPIVRRELAGSWLGTRPLRFLPATYRYYELRRLRNMIPPMKGRSLIGVDTRCNRFRIQAISPEYLPAMKSIVQRWGSQRDEIIFGVTGQASATDCVGERWPPRPDSICFVNFPRTSPRSRFVLLAARVPEFGGGFFDSTGVLNVYLTNLRRKATATPIAKCELKRTRHEGRPIRFLQAKYTFNEFFAIESKIPSFCPGFSGWRIDEERNRLVIMAVSAEQTECMRSRIEKAGLPLDAFRFEVAGFFHPV